MTDPETGGRSCDECGSPFIPEASAMSDLCAECAHWLYGYDPCVHTFEKGRCVKCGWDGSTSTYVESLKEED